MACFALKRLFATTGVIIDGEIIKLAGNGGKEVNVVTSSLRVDTVAAKGLTISRK